MALEIIRFENRKEQLRLLSGNSSGNSGEEHVDPDATGDASDQPTNFRGGRLRTGYAGGGSPTKLVPLWEQRADALTMYLSSSVVHNGKVYAASTYLDMGQSYGSVLCVDAATGELLWETLDKKPGTPFRGFFSSPSVTADGSRVLIGQGLHADAEQELVCLDAETGEVVWLVETPLHIESSPAIDGDIVVVGAGAIEGPDRKPKSHPGFVLAVRISTGEVLWRFDLADPESSPAIHDGIAFIGSGFNGSQLVALRLEGPDEQREVWRVDTPNPAIGPITVTDELVLAGGGNSDFVVQAANPQGFVIAVNRENGQVAWRATMPDAVLGPIAVHEQVAVCPVRNGELIAIDLDKQGEVVWRARVNDDAPLLAGPAHTGTHVYAVSNNGYLAIFDASDGTQLERHYLNAPDKPGELGLSTSAPFISGGRVYVGSETGGLRAYAGAEVK